MPAPWDTVVSIGGQSFIDGLWRLLGPALEGLTNPLPLALPGFSNARMRVTQIVPEFTGAATTPGLRLRAEVEVVAEALLHVMAAADTVDIALGPQNFSLTSLTGDLDIPVQNGSLTNILLSGTGALTGALNLGPGTGDVQLPATTATLSNMAGAGTLALPPDLSLPAIPFPAVVPVPLDLTPTQPLDLRATVELTVTPPSAATRFALLFRVSNVTMGPVLGIDPNLPTTATAALQAAVNQVVAQLGVSLPPPTVDVAKVTALVAPVPNLVAAAFDDALTRLMAETGRLLYPPAGTGASCDVRVLPTEADATLTWATSSYRLQVAFKRASSTDITALPSFTPAGLVDVNVLVGNSFLISMMCCLVERLPAFSLPVAATTGTTDVAGTAHLMCCNFTGVTANFGGVAVGGGGLSVCIDGASGGAKRFSLVGSFTQGVPNVIPLISGIFPTLATVTVRFTLPLGFDFNDAAAIANLRVSGTPTVAAAVTPSPAIALVLIAIGVLVALVSVSIGGGLVGAILGGISLLLAPMAAAIVLLLVYFACGAASYLLNNAVRTVLGGASLVRSPVALPPGVFEAFGGLSPVTVTVDDLDARGVLHTPTSPWALLPRLGRQRFVPDFDRPIDFPVDRVVDRPRDPTTGTTPTGTTQPGGAGTTTVGTTAPTGPGSVGAPGGAIPGAEPHQPGGAGPPAQAGPGTPGQAGQPGTYRSGPGTGEEGEPPPSA